MPKFQDTRDTLADRPWCVDDLDAALDRLTSENNPVKKAVFFCDNAGSDVILGILPFARELTKYGCNVMIAANGVAAINDVTAEELRQWIAKAAVTDRPLSRAVRDKKLIVVSTGTDNCVIDLRKVRPCTSALPSLPAPPSVEEDGHSVSNVHSEVQVSRVEIWRSFAEPIKCKLNSGRDVSKPQLKRGTALALNTELTANTSFILCLILKNASGRMCQDIALTASEKLTVSVDLYMPRVLRLTFKYIATNAGRSLMLSNAHSSILPPLTLCCSAR
jgi:hypothetical protein